MWQSLILCAVALTHLCYGEYIAGVVEYNPVKQSEPSFTKEENADSFVDYIQDAKRQSAQIIVFPEYGLTGFIDNPQDYAVDVPPVGTSNFSDIILTKISKAAIENRLYVVINLIEKKNGTNNSSIYYNTNLVFADDGTLIAKYRKINLFQEPKLTPGTKPVTFKTTFGTFGLMSGMDILYHNPSQTMLENKEVTDVIYPALWNSSVPLYMSLEVQAGYALANKVNLLAANVNDPTHGRGGSGIYWKNGTVLRVVLKDKSQSVLAFANMVEPNPFTLSGFDIFKNDSGPELANYKVPYDYQNTVFKSVDLSQENITQEICAGKFCCTFNIVALKNETNSSEIYKLAAFNGKAKIGNKLESVQHCNLVACLNEDKSSCGQRSNSTLTTKFRQILVWGTFRNESGSFYRPSSLRANLLPVYNVTYVAHEHNNSIAIKFNLTQPSENVVLFGLYGRSGAGALNISVLLVSVIFFIHKLF